MNEYLGRVRPFGAPGFTDVFPDKERTKKYQDSPLSPDGIKLVRNQLASRRPAFVDESDDIDLIVVSPLRRALQTYDLGLRPHLDGKNIPVVALPHAAERVYLVSDIGSPIDDLKQAYPYVNFDGISKEPWWWTPNGSYNEWRPTGQRQTYACPAEPTLDFAERMQGFRKWLDQRQEQKIVVVCHHGVIDWMIGMDFANCQWRQVPFSHLSPACLSSLKE